MFFVSVDSKKLSHFVSLLFSTLTSKSTSVDSKGLALHQNCAEKSCFSYVFKRIKRVTLRWRDLIPRLTGREHRQIAQVYLSVIIPPGYLKSRGKGVVGQFPVNAASSTGRCNNTSP